MSLMIHMKPISYLNARAAKIAKQLKEGGEPFTITQNGGAVMVVQSVAEYEKNQNTLAMLKMIHWAEQSIAEGKTMSVGEVFLETRAKYGLK